MDLQKGFRTDDGTDVVLPTCSRDATIVKDAGHAASTHALRRKDLSYPRTIRELIDLLYREMTVEIQSTEQDGAKKASASVLYPGFCATEPIAYVTTLCSVFATSRSQLLLPTRHRSTVFSPVCYTMAAQTSVLQGASNHLMSRTHLAE
jgi:hypothetical protein